MQPLVSVVLCTYNTEKYLREAVLSILNQTYRNFELIIWDDGSTDNTRSVVATIDDYRIRYFYHDNTGLSVALKLASEQANGKYIARMDADDISLPQRFEKEVSFLENNPDFVLVSSSVYYIDEEGDVIGRSFACTDCEVIQQALLWTNLIVHPMAMFRRDAYNSAGGYLPVKISEDRIFWSRLSKQGKMMNIATPLGKYRLLSNSLDHIYNPYFKIILEFRNKLVADEVILESDIKLYNSLSEYSKKFVSRKTDNHLERRETKEEKLFSVIKVFFGERMAESFIVGIKNIYYRMLLKKRIK